MICFYRTLLCGVILIVAFPGASNAKCQLASNHFIANSYITPFGLVTSDTGNAQWVGTADCGNMGGLQQGRFTYLNPFWAECLGWTMDELFSRPFISFVHRDDIESTQAAFSRLINDKLAVVGFRNRYCKADGKYVWLEWTSRVGFDGEIVASALPINEKQKLKQIEEKQRGLLEQAESLASIGHWSVDVNTQSVFWSDEIYRIHGVDKSDYQPNLDTAIQFYHPDDIASVQQYVEEAMMRGEGWEFKLRIVRPSGEIRHVRSKAQIHRDEHGEVMSLFGIFQDISDVVRINELNKLHAKVAETSGAGIVITDAKRKVIWVNHAFESMTGFQLEDVKGSGLAGFLQGKHTSQETISEIRRGLDENENINVEILNYHKDGSEYWNNLIISPVYDGNTLTHYVGIQNNITPRIEQKTQLMNAQKVALAGELAAGICHDLNNVLGVISGNADLLLLSPDYKKEKLQVEKISGAVVRAKRVTDRLLKLVKPSPKDTAQFNVDELLNSELEFYKEIVPKVC